MTIGVTREENDPEDLRRTLLPVRNVEVGVSEVAKLKRVRFPAGRTTLLRPWSIVETVSLQTELL
jgi:hypothetical protein